MAWYKHILHAGQVVTWQDRVFAAIRLFRLFIKRTRDRSHTCGVWDEDRGWGKSCASVLSSFRLHLDDNAPIYLVSSLQQNDNVHVLIQK